jgi:hypothetical protein
MSIDAFRDELEFELKLITDDFNETLRKNSEDLIARICLEIDMIEKEFDKIE